MGIKYQCKNNNCHYPGDTRFEMIFTSETIMDSHNIASVFCPFCRKELKQLEVNDTLSQRPAAQQGSEE